MPSTSAIFLDVANTLLHKPGLYPAIQSVLRVRGIDIPLPTIIDRHRLVSEVVLFPDKTSQDFYVEFNGHFLRSLGIVPESSLLDALFSACTYLPWEPFADTAVLAGLPVPLGILSNWDASLPEKLGAIENARFQWILGSADQGVRKPDPRFFARIMESTGIEPAEILYVGDSVKLDIEPALRAGIRAVLVDRDGLYPHGNAMRITSIDQLGALL
jgi:HAD superfamily hydrolase (TIGR01493 family)